LGLLWIGLFLLPVSNLLPMMQYMAERFLYMPLIGWLWMLALLLVSLPRPRLLATLAVVLLGSWAAVGWERSWIWQDEVTLFVQSSQAGPKTQRVQDNAVAAILALPHVRTMFTLDPKQGVLRVTDTVPEGSLQPIHDTLAEAHRLFPDDERLSSALAIVCARSGRLDQAIPLFQAAADKSPHNARPWANLGQACVEMKSWPQAEKALRKALTIDPNQTDALQAFAALAWHRDDYAAALAAFQKLKTLEPNEPEHDHWIQKAEAKLQSSP
jgi:tetratricopeptide (TPR) repeat protein